MLAALEDPNERLNGVTIRNVYDYVMGNYATIPQYEVDDNLNKINKSIDASRTITVYIRKKELCQKMAEDVHVPITEATMVTTGPKNAVATGGMDYA